MLLNQCRLCSMMSYFQLLLHFLFRFSFLSYLTIYSHLPIPFLLHSPITFSHFISLLTVIYYFLFLFSVFIFIPPHFISFSFPLSAVILLFPFPVLISISFFHFSFLFLSFSIYFHLIFSALSISLSCNFFPCFLSYLFLPLSISFVFPIPSSPLPL